MKTNTKGPWVWSQLENAGGIYLCTPHSGCLLVMDFVRQGMSSAQPRFARWEGKERGRMGGVMVPAEQMDLDRHPDAKLIAAAPDLLEACRLCLRSMDLATEQGFEINREAYFAARDAIEKAKVQPCD